MKSINPNDLSKKENYKLLSGSVIPRPIAFVTSLNDQDVLNAAPFSFFNMVGSEPPLIVLSIGRSEGKVSKHTAINILNRKEFVVHVLDLSLLESLNQTSAPYAEDISEVERAGFSTVDSTEIKTPGVQEAKIRLECELFEHLPLGEQGIYHHDLIIGKVVQYHIDEQVYDDGKILAEQLNPIARLAGPNYAHLSEQIYLERPTKGE
ncbi:flavin reductase family protein [Aquisalibacillus elongatus]|uniref:Flavin reductase (DIM6/NTAB) family NADH-FMN oxidoreductase RutF n=1 Tax=Aquisalibacillus elongatus TaxID=485577 RepID=A0A3N5BQN8_9BACI|nr:flavin reductase family protein [Aquisalibacillus elongatus]RPF52088.1 flavin reductase (DIM6/NTAB) family NADH-FMN oxidoreductase RutF [Aquisalibacillus elongatus]